MSTTYNGPQHWVENIPASSKRRTSKKETDEMMKYLISRIIALNYLLNRLDGIREELKEIEDIALLLYREEKKSE